MPMTWTDENMANESHWIWKGYHTYWASGQDLDQLELKSWLHSFLSVGDLCFLNGKTVFY